MSRHASPWWSREVHADRRPLLLTRNAIKAAIRDYLASEGFVEIEPTCLQVSPGNETHLHAFETALVGTDLARQPLYLHTSPEFAMKKLLAAGEQRIFSLAPVFRNRERGPLHAPEFTMLEWYRVGEPVSALWRDLARFLAIAADVAGRKVWSWRGRTLDPNAELAVTTVDRAFVEHAGLDLAGTYDANSVDRAALAARASAAGFPVASDDTWSDIFSKVLTEAIEPKLGSPRAELLIDYPIHEAALARPVQGRPQHAERFELYVAGVELANGFGELTDGAEQRRRFEHEMAEKERIYGERYPIDEDFLLSLAHMPAASGCALGFDRLVLLATGAARITDVQWTPMP